MNLLCRPTIRQAGISKDNLYELCPRHSFLGKNTMWKKHDFGRIPYWWRFSWLYNYDLQFPKAVEKQQLFLNFSPFQYQGRNRAKSYGIRQEGPLFFAAEGVWQKENTPAKPLDVVIQIGSNAGLASVFTILQRFQTSRVRGKSTIC